MGGGNTYSWELHSGDEICILKNVDANNWNNFKKWYDVITKVFTFFKENKRIEVSRPVKRFLEFLKTEGKTKDNYKMNG